MAASRLGKEYDDAVLELEYLVGLKTRPFRHDSEGVKEEEEKSSEDDFVALLRALDVLSEQEDKIPSVAPPSSADSVAAAFAEFTTWLAERGVAGVGDKLEFGVGLGEAGNGLVTTEDLRAGDPFVFIHQRHMMREETAKSCPVLGPFASDDKVVSAFPDLLMALHLLQEATDGPSSPWAPYLAILPATFNTPLFWSVRDVRALASAASPALDEAYKIVVNAVKQYVYLAPRLAAFTIAHNRFSWKNLAWALSVVATRKNLIPKESSKLTRSKKDLALTQSTPTEIALVPVWDMCNHDGSDPDTAEITTFYNVAVCGMEGMAMRDFAAGESVSIFYGPRSSEALLLHSGFVPEYTNAWDTYRVQLNIKALPGRQPLDETDPVQKLVPIILYQAKIANECTFFLNNQMLDDNILMFFRIGCIDNMDDMSRRDKPLAGSATSINNDINAHKCYADLVASLLESKPSIARNNPAAYLENNARNIHIARLVLGEIHLLQKNLVLVEQVIERLETKRARNAAKNAAKRRKKKQQKQQQQQEQTTE